MRDARDPTSPSVGNAVDVDPADQATRRTCFGFLGIWYTLHKNSGWLPGAGFANECKAEPLADNHLSSRGVVGFEPAPHIQRIEEKKHRHRAENAPDPPPKSSKNGGRRHSFGCPEGSGVPQKSI